MKYAAILGAAFLLSGCAVLPAGLVTASTVAAGLGVVAASEQLDVALIHWYLQFRGAEAVRVPGLSITVLVPTTPSEE